MYLYKDGGFYSSALQADYEAVGTWPEGGVEVSDEDYKALVEQMSTMDIKPDANGYPVAVPRT